MIMMTPTWGHLAEVEGVGPDVNEAVEGDEDQQHNQDGHDYLILIGVHNTPGPRQIRIVKLLAAVTGNVRVLHEGRVQ